MEAAPTPPTNPAAARERRALCPGSAAAAPSSIPAALRLLLPASWSARRARQITASPHPALRCTARTARRRSPGIRGCPEPFCAPARRLAGGECSLLVGHRLMLCLAIWAPRRARGAPALLLAARASHARCRSGTATSAAPSRPRPRPAGRRQAIAACVAFRRRELRRGRLRLMKRQHLRISARIRRLPSTAAASQLSSARLRDG